MFSGIIKDIGLVKYTSKNREVISIETSFSNIKMGESISCAGVCLTVSRIEGQVFFSDLSPETLEKTTLSKLKVGDYINLEKSLKMGQEISGHMVFGHVDGFSKINNIKKLKDSWLFEFEASENIMKFLTDKCSIAINGISLTVNDVSNKSFKVAIIPHTWESTSLKFNKVGDFMNTEIDMLARYVFKALKK
ncbi:MAG: riboflavin synthase [Rickettsiales bacterium]|nr:riboflavin synthase [Rickettsiales bacterium]